MTQPSPLPARRLTLPVEAPGPPLGGEGSRRVSRALLPLYGCWKPGPRPAAVPQMSPRPRRSGNWSPSVFKVLPKPARRSEAARSRPSCPASLLPQPERLWRWPHPCVGPWAPSTAAEGRLGGGGAGATPRGSARGAGLRPSPCVRCLTESPSPPKGPRPPPQAGRFKSGAQQLPSARFSHVHSCTHADWAARGGTLAGRR